MRNASSATQSGIRKDGRADRGAFLAAGPALLWQTLFLLLPLVLIGGISFFSRGAYGEIEFPLTLENYRRLLGFGWLGFEAVYPVIFLKSIILGIATALLCLIAGLPLAFFIAGRSDRFKTVALTLVVIPFWTNLLIRTYAWQILLSNESPLTRLLHALGLGSPGEPFYPGPGAVLIGMICDFLPFMALPLYASVEKIDWTIADAAADLGAGRWQVFRHALLPQIYPGMLAGTVLVLLPATGQFVIPDLLGGAKTVLLGNAIQQQFGQSRDWPFGSAISFAALGLLLMTLWVFARRNARQESELI
jgi:spermidine/putrescine transport system permease protein